jgi:16S rRNA (adenine1518-N6/adenine1519-N6)-dimethyltransferase
VGQPPFEQGEDAACERPADRLLGATDVRGLAERHGVRPTKQWGQNFVIDGNTVRRIVATADISEDDVVVEVGPGLGSLTLALLPRAGHVIAVEVDPVLAAALPETVAQFAPSYADRLTVIADDALRLKDLPMAPDALVANLPYNVAVPVLLTMLARFASIQRVLVMVQAEVADRLAASPGTKSYGVPSAKARWYGDVRRAGAIGRTVFWPAPNVDSGLVLLTRTTPPPCAASRENVFAVIDAAFAQRRKTIRSALSGLAGSPVIVESAAQAAGIDPGARGEVLDIGQFARLTDALISAGARGLATP